MALGEMGACCGQGERDEEGIPAVACGCEGKIRAEKESEAAAGLDRT